MGFFDKERDAHEQVMRGEHHEAKTSHELIGGAAAYEAMKAYNEHCEREGRPQSHETAKELLAGFAGAALDRIIETKGLDQVDKFQARRHAEEQAKRVADEQY